MFLELDEPSLELDETRAMVAEGADDDSVVSCDEELNPRIDAKQRSLIEKIKGIAAPFLRALNLELFDLQCNGRQLRFYIDKEGGVSIDDCAKFSRLLAPALDVSDPMAKAYTLEVSSPGLNRPLLKKEDYLRSIGKKVKIKTLNKIDAQKSFTGQLSDFVNDTIVLTLDGNKQCEIPLACVTQARLEVEFPSKQTQTKQTQNRKQRKKG